MNRKAIRELAIIVISALAYAGCIIDGSQHYVSTRNNGHILCLVILLFAIGWWWQQPNPRDRSGR